MGLSRACRRFSGPGERGICKPPPILAAGNRKRAPLAPGGAKLASRPLASFQKSTRFGVRMPGAAPRARRGQAVGVASSGGQGQPGGNGVAVAADRSHQRRMDQRSRPARAPARRGAHRPRSQGKSPERPIEGCPETGQPQRHAQRDALKPRLGKDDRSEPSSDGRPSKRRLQDPCAGNDNPPSFSQSALGHRAEPRPAGGRDVRCGMCGGG